MSEPALLPALLGEGAALLRGAGVPDPRREAARLWADLQGLPSYAFLARAHAVSDDASARYRRAVARRAAGEPLSYVTGLAGFRGLTLRADRRALIPRPETEGLVEHVLRRMPRGIVVDVGTGTGCIALALAEEGTYRAVLGVDRSPEALALARENRGRSGLAVTFLAGDLLTAFEPRSLDAVVSNPPYLSEAEYVALEPAVRAFEPREALVSGRDGLDATRRLLRQAAMVLRPGGLVAIEIDARRGGESAGLAREAGLVAVQVHDDLYGRARYLLARRSECP